METVTQKGSEFNQTSFKGGMNLLLDDTRLDTTEYRVGFDLTNRYDTLDPVLGSVLDPAAPQGLKQELVTFGNFIVLFVAGFAYYRYYTDSGWQRITSFKMSSTAPRYWTVPIPVSTTNYVRFAYLSTGSVPQQTNSLSGVQSVNVTGVSNGNLSGLLVQDNISQPVFIFINAAGLPEVRTTQSYSQWSITYTDSSNTVVKAGGDKREYVPIGNCMAWTNGILFITSQDFNSIYRSVSGRPLDFMVNVTSKLATNAPYTQVGGGDATTTNYSVGLGNITCIRPLSTGGIFVSASGSNFTVTFDYSNQAPKIFGEYTFVRSFLFNSVCLSDRAIFDTIGDTRFIELTGIRSFNAIKQAGMEGQNAPFSATIHGIFGPDEDPIIQGAGTSAAILYNNYELYGLNTILGFCIAKYDTLNNCWVSFDFQQTGGKAVKMFAKIELSINRLYAITEDDQLYTLYIGPNVTTPSFRSLGINSSILWAGNTVKMAHPKLELKCDKVRAILNKITANSECDMALYCNNRLVKGNPFTKGITYELPPVPSSDSLALPDVDTQLMNMLWSTSDAEQGWKYFAIFKWTGGSFTQFSLEMQELMPANPEYSQGLTQ